MDKKFDISDALQTVIIVIIILGGYFVELFKRWMRRRKEEEKRLFGEKEHFENEVRREPLRETRPQQNIAPVNTNEEEDFDEEGDVPVEMPNEMPGENTRSEEKDFEQEIEKLPDFVKMFFPKLEEIKRRTRETQRDVKIDIPKKNEIIAENEFQLPSDTPISQSESSMNFDYGAIEKEREISIEFSNQNILNGIIFREIVGQPKAFRRRK